MFIIYLNLIVIHIDISINKNTINLNIDVGNLIINDNSITTDCLYMIHDYYYIDVIIYLNQKNMNCHYI